MSTGPIDGTVTAMLLDIQRSNVAISEVVLRLTEEQRLSIAPMLQRIIEHQNAALAALQ